MTFAKRAQVGVVMSRFADPEPASAHGASLVRGRIHADMVSTSHNAERLEKLVAPRLAQLARAYPHLVQHPRAAGYAFAFDLPTPALLDAFIGQRFWRGAVVFAAGTRTARYRLSDTFHAREIDMLFETIRKSLSWLDAHDGEKPPEWEDQPAPPPHKPPQVELRYRHVPHGEAMDHLPAILDIEYQVYEPARRTPPAEIRAAIEDPEGSLIVAEAPTPGGRRWQLVGFAIGGPLEQNKDVEGCDDDPMLGKHNTMYSVSITVAPGHQSSGIGRKLKEMQLRDAAARERADGSPRYRYVTGRNRVGRTAQMTHLNRVFGAHVVTIMTGQYEDPEGQAIYYRIPLGRSRRIRRSSRTSMRRRARRRDTSIDRARPRVGPDPAVRERPESLRRAEEQGLLYGPAVNKLTLMNYVTPGDGARARVDRRAGARAAAHVPDVVARRGHRQGAAPDPRARASRRRSRSALRAATRPHRRRRRARSGIPRCTRRTGPLRVAARPASGDRGHRRDDRGAARGGRGGRRARQRARLRLRARAGAHRLGATARTSSTRSAGCAASSTCR